MQELKERIVVTDGLSVNDQPQSPVIIEIENWDTDKINDIFDWDTVWQNELKVNEEQLSLFILNLIKVGDVTSLDIVKRYLIDLSGLLAKVNDEKHHKLWSNSSNIIWMTPRKAVRAKLPPFLEWSYGETDYNYRKLSELDSLLPYGGTVPAILISHSLIPYTEFITNDKPCYLHNGIWFVSERHWNGDPDGITKYMIECNLENLPKRTVDNYIELLKG